MAGRYGGLGFSGPARGYADTTGRFGVGTPTSPSLGGSGSGTFGRAPSWTNVPVGGAGLGAEGAGAMGWRSPAPSWTNVPTAGSGLGAEGAGPIVGRIPASAYAAAALRGAARVSGALAVAMLAYDFAQFMKQLQSPVPGSGVQMIYGWHRGYSRFCTGSGTTAFYGEPFGTCDSIAAVAGITGVTGVNPYSGFSSPRAGSDFVNRTEGYVRIPGSTESPLPLFWPAPWLPFPYVAPWQNPLPQTQPQVSPFFKPGTAPLVHPLPGTAPFPGWPPYPAPSPYTVPGTKPAPAPGPAVSPAPSPSPSPSPAPSPSPRPPRPGGPGWPFPNPLPGAPTMPVLPVFPPGPLVERPIGSNRGTRNIGRQVKHLAVWRLIANIVTEGVDTLECAWGALPKEARVKGAKSTPKVGGSCRTPPKNWKYYDPNKDGGKGGWVTKYAKDRRGRPAKPTPQVMAGDVARCWGKINWSDFHDCFVKNVITDAGIGLLAGGARRGQARSPSSPGPRGVFGTGA